MSPWKPFLLAATSALAVAPASRCVAHPESIGNWMPCFAVALGLADEGLPSPGEFVDEFTATVAKPAAIAALGLAGLRAGDRVILTNHYSGYWTIAHADTKRRVKVPLAWNVRFGLRPEPDLADGDPPDRICGRVLEPAIVAQYGFASARGATRFTLEYGDAGWVLGLEPGGEKRKVPF